LPDGVILLTPYGAGSCTLGATMPDGSRCEVQCSANFVVDEDARAAEYSCSNGILTEPEGLCDPNGCVLPLEFETGVQGFKDGGCVPGESLPSGTACRMRCAPGYTLIKGSPIFACALGELRYADMICEIEQCPYLKNEQCFDWQYSCTLCCTTGFSSEGMPCWNNGFSHEDCCTNPAPPEPAPADFLSAPQNTDGKCSLDPTCFDALYTCRDCCGNDGVTQHGNMQCWDHYYTPERCCYGYSASISPVYPAPVPVEFSSDTGSCALDAKCFDPTEYVCHLCCNTDTSRSGHHCWDTQYLKSECCLDGQAATTAPQLPVVQFKSLDQHPGPRPSRAQAVPVDSRGWAVTLPGIDSRGRPIAVADESAPSSDSVASDAILLGSLAGGCVALLAAVAAMRRHHRRGSANRVEEVSSEQSTGQQPHRGGPRSRSYRVQPLDAVQLEGDQPLH